MGFFSKLFENASKNAEFSSKQTSSSSNDEDISSSKSTNAFHQEASNYVFLDVETPNKGNDSICQIAAIKTDRNGNQIRHISTYVNPETYFDEVNISVHGILPAHVSSAPTFRELWEDELCTFLKDSIIVAHNAKFDLSVLTKTLAVNGYELPEFDYLCTLSLGASTLPNCSRRGLKDMCELIGYQLDNHHDALEDTRACMAVFWRCAEISPYMPQPQTYNFKESHSRIYDRSDFFKNSEKTKALKYLKTYMEAAIQDEEISLDEALDIQEVINNSEDLRKDKSLSSISDLLQEVLQDGYIDPEESKRLIKEFGYYIDPLSLDDGTVSFEGMSFMLTGDFEHGDKSEVAEYIVSKGGNMLKSVTKSCNYLAVGALGSDAWSFGNYGNKVKKAMEWKAKGQPIMIISEKTLFGS